MSRICRYTISVVLLLIASLLAKSQVTPSGNQNYVYTRTILKDNVKTQGDLDALTSADVRAEIQYFDGLGRPMQNISVQAAPGFKDIVTPIAYDAFGRQDKGYLPYAASGTSGSYRSSGLTEQASFYGTAQTSIPVIPNPYSQKVFEASPLSRVLEVAAPGQSWALGSGHTVQTRYEVNGPGDNVRLWDIQNNGMVNTGAVSTGYYDAGQLYKNVTLDEHQNEVVEYKDKEGQVVCKKVQDGGTTGSPSYMVTQYVYDDFNQLAYVIPPALESITSFTESDQDFLKYIYAYHYDERLRLVEKKIPGKGWEYTVYSLTDRPVLTQDAAQRDRGVWAFIKYDALGRVVITGETANPDSRAALQLNANGRTVHTEARDNTQPWGYSNVAIPTTVTKVLTVNYYDDYSIFSATNPFSTFFTQPNGTQNESQRTKGLPTVTATNVLGTTTYLYTATYYTDDKARVSKVVKQHQLNGVDITTSTYNFAGELTTIVRQHYNNNNTASPVVMVTTTNQYDQAGRLKQTQEIINSQQPVTTNYTYNAVGQLERKSVGGQDIDYQYNARGWLARQSSALFTQELKYDDASQNAQFNGNIAQQLWSTNGQNHNYNYSYDKANRLLSGISDENNNETMGYDKMGNITSLYRQGAAAITSGLGTLSYTYNGNQLQSVNGGYVKNYQYNNNGSMTSDGMFGFQYNELNLPRQVTGTPVGTVTYTYDASGAKLTKQTVSETRQYVEGIEYTGGNIDLLHISSGLARNSGGIYNYEFFLTDHLGNTRVVHNGAGTVYQRTDYMPFGMSIGRVANTPNKYLYNGKEQQQELGGTDGGQYDYGARFYDPVIGRWHVIDPLAEKMRRHSPYNYAFDNPIRFVDPDGMEADNWYKAKNKEGKETYMWVEGSREIEGAENMGQELSLETVGRQSGKVYDSYNLNADGSITNNITSEITTNKIVTENDVTIKGADAPGLTTFGIHNSAVGLLGTSPLKIGSLIKSIVGLFKSPQSVEKAAIVGDEIVQVFHKGELSGGVVSSTRSLSTGLDKAAVEALNRSGKVWEFNIPKTQFLKWKYAQKLELFRDLDEATKVINEEVRFSPELAPFLNKYLIKP
ncbi:DUF6443 domain-containing protein [Niabella sp. CC-SYL272]|uniref:DUF6443 domain-containing protein n=1 Tax=Niabella agricola TaxID=2891571 RepID=UPI001F223215|nr:DUF6443 domain-containing protein [Niabella agricola]MCF3109424.1 DUF6443 domain-containing protein [Niabella agricola]